MIKKFFSCFTILCCLFLCTSCFDVLEEINLNSDGSGSMVLTVNMSKSKTKLASIMLLDSVNGYKIPSEDDIDEALKDVVLHLKKANGISNIKQTKDFDNYIFTVSCDFEDIASLNGIAKDLIKEQNAKGKTNFNTTNFSFDVSSKIFQRHFVYDESIKKSFLHLKKEDRKVFNDANFIAIYRFDNTVENISNSNAKISPNKKAVMLRLDAMSLIMGERSIQNKIKLTK
ncbi:hypothetical protein [Costertonia aggregata]|uniref:SIMPL domain-containing protein n=1 Tax=Costertonia aggregata TaxID=343403 RepID=A0A7H9APN1_9FLAO|nr:hypothetical protein [Costertonia aggregata]QLG45431.1 hypothetical protein HYG79_08760 [Costertonia aggregata]